MAALSYLLLPISGSIAFFSGRSERVRRHGLQAIILGALWPGALFLCSAISPGATQAAAVVGGVVWVGLVLSTACGADLWLPGLSRIWPLPDSTSRE